MVTLGSSVVISFALALVACSGTTKSQPADARAPVEPVVEDDAGETPDASVADTSTVDAAKVDKAAACASTFGKGLTAGFGRLDGVVTAIVKPSDTQCPLPNNDHVIVQVKMKGEVYRVVVNVQSDRPGSDIRVRYLEKAIKLPAPAFSEGWNTGVKLDYVADLGVKIDDFTPYELTVLSDKVADVIPLGAKVSVYSDTSGGSSSHLVHRNDGTKDGAIVIDPEGASPKALLFAFATQTF